MTFASPARGHRLPIGLVRVVGESMEPTLCRGDVLLVRWGRPPQVGHIVVAELPGGRGPGVKRVTHRDGAGWWLERDNPSVGVDSWLFGAVTDQDVVGVVVARLWPRPRLPR